MIRIIFILLAVVTGVTATNLAAQTPSQDLETYLWQNFFLTAASGNTPAYLTPHGGVPFDVAARVVRDGMNNDWPANTDVQTSTSPVIRWVNQSPGADWTQDDGVLLVTGADGNPGASVVATITGERSAVYCIGGLGVGANASGGSAEAYSEDADIGGIALAWAGDAASGNGDGGFAYAVTEAAVAGNAAAAFGGHAGAGGSGDGGDAWATSTNSTGGATTGTAFAAGGNAESGLGGYGVAWSRLDSFAWGGDATSGDAGTAQAHALGNSGSFARADGGHATTGDGGNALAASRGDCIAFGGDSTGGGDGGGATADAYLGYWAYAEGGTATGFGDGGDAWATSRYSYADAVGGDAADGVGGYANARVFGDGIGAFAEGGACSVASGGAVSQGGNADARVDAGATGDAEAIGGRGNIGGYAVARMFSTGHAEATGGTGLGASGTQQEQGGDAILGLYDLSATGSAAGGNGDPNIAGNVGGEARMYDDPAEDVFDPSGAVYIDFPNGYLGGTYP